MKNKYFVFSDIHGEYISLVDTLSKAGFEPDNPKHILICIGDGFDRGLDSRAIYELFVNCPRHIYVRGNHDNMLQEALEKGMDGEYVLFNILHNGLKATLDSFCGNDGKSFMNTTSVKDLEKEITAVRTMNPGLLKWLQARPLYYETKHFIFVHAGLDPNEPNWQNTSENFMLWDIEHSHEPITSTTKIVIIGHHHAFRVRNNALNAGIQPRHKLERNITYFGNKDEHAPVQIKNKIAIDGCVNYTHKPNILVFEDEPLDEQTTSTVNQGCADIVFDIPTFATYDTFATTRATFTSTGIHM